MLAAVGVVVVVAVVAALCGCCCGCGCDPRREGAHPEAQTRQVAIGRHRIFVQTGQFMNQKGQTLDKIRLNTAGFNTPFI
jgi:hypothetical protein